MASYTPEQLAALYAQRAREVPDAARRGFRNWLTTVDRAAVKNLTGGGSDAPGSYPVPIRRGNLRRGQGTRVTGEMQGIVFNRTAYANAIHRGMTPYNNPKARYSYLGRPFLDDAVASVDALDIATRPIRKVLGL